MLLWPWVSVVTRSKDASSGSAANNFYREAKDVNLESNPPSSFACVGSSSSAKASKSWLRQSAPEPFWPLFEVDLSSGFIWLLGDEATYADMAFPEFCAAPNVSPASDFVSRVGLSASKFLA